MKDNNKIKEKKKTNFLGKLLHFFLGLMVISSILFLGYNLFFNIADLDSIINSGLIVIITSLFVISLNVKRKKLFSTLTAFFITLFIAFTFLTTSNTFSFKKTIPNFYNTNINDAIKWANENNIKYENIYESSDDVKEFFIINQSVSEGTAIHNIENIKFYVSSGPDYNKDVIIPNMVGWNIDDALTTINENNLNNVEINYELSADIEKDIIISQNINGMIKRNDKITITVSMGTEDTLIPIEMIDLNNKTIFEATLWLKRNGIKYELSYEFSDSIKRNNVISQSVDAKTTVDPKNDSISLLISKGTEIKVPNLNNMTTEEIIEWISNNKLKITFEEQYSTDVELGKIISASHKEGDIVEEGTTINIITSKGSLKMKKFNSLTEFRTWASKNEISIQEEFEFNDSISKGNIIKFSVEEGAVINTGDTIIVYISNGKAVIIPNFISKNKSNITTLCNNLGLNCTFSYSYSNSVTKGLAISQNKKANSTVVSGTYVNITLSNGPKPASSSNNNNSSSNNNSSGSTKPTCDKSKTQQVYITPGNTGNDTKANIKNAYPNIKWNFKFVTQCPNGDSANGTVCNASAIDEKHLNYCDTYTVTIVNIQ